jgi:uncharacterized protein YegL
MTSVKTDGGPQVLPFYILCDESASMDGVKLDAVNQGLPNIHAAVSADPIVNDKVRVGVISFSDTAEELVPLTKLGDLTQMPGLVSKGGTSYTAAFKVAKSAIDRDVANLKSSGLQVLRPVIFFISDGEPTSPDWPTAHAALTSPNNPYAPHILAFGITGAIGQVIKEVATVINRLGKKFAWLADDGTDPGAVVKEIINQLLNTIVGSGRNQNPVLVLPTPPVGVIDLDPV